MELSSLKTCKIRGLSKLNVQLRALVTIWYEMVYIYPLQAPKVVAASRLLNRLERLRCGSGSYCTHITNLQTSLNNFQKENRSP